MQQAGQIALVPFPFTNLGGSKLRPVLLLCKASRHYDDWLVCMISSQLNQAEPELDEIMLPEHPEHSDFPASGLKLPSVLRLSRLAVLDGRLLIGALGTLSGARLHAIRQRLGQWITGDGTP